MKKFALPLCSILLFTLAACSSQDVDMPEQTATGKTVTVKIPFRIENVGGGGTRSLSSEGIENIVDDENIAIQNLTVIQFNGLGLDAQMVGVPHPVAKTAIDGTQKFANVQLTEFTGEQTLVVVANLPATAPNWNLPAGATLRTLADIGRSMSISTESNLHTNIDGEETILMSGILTTTAVGGMNDLTDTNPVVLKRHVAKVTLNLTVDATATGVTVTSVRLCNAPTRLAMADAVLNLTNPTLWPAFPSGFNYDVETFDAPMVVGDTKSISWYVPRNQRGAVTNEDVTKKNAYAPQGATYIEVVAVKNSQSSAFRIYPGENQTNDFNLKSNHHYTLGLTVKGLGPEIPGNDSRVESFGDVDCSADVTSNSYIINPPPTGTRTYTFSIEKSNAFWSSADPGYGGGTDPTKIISATNSTWTMTLEWEDGMMSVPAVALTTPIFVDATVAPVTPSVYFGTKGGTYVSATNGNTFSLKVPAGVPSGNFLLTLRRGGNTGEKLYSWHFWVTDYNPDSWFDAGGTLQNGVYTYEVPGGQVDRYADGMSAMMDRNLGALGCKPNAGVDSRGIFHYQWGRKEPMPASFGDSHLIYIQAPASMATAIQNPTTLYLTGESVWCTDLTTQNSDRIWGDYNTLVSSHGKAFMDPCPKGWKVPEYGVFQPFVNVGTVNATNATGSYTTHLNATNRPELDWNTGGGINGSGLRFWPGGQTDPVNGVIYFPTAGYRSYTTGSLSRNGLIRFILWYSTLRLSSTSAYGLDVSQTNVNIAGGGIVSYPLSIRCQRE
jgi:hypothetical protein